MASSTVRPLEIEFLHEQDSKSYYRLCKNIVEKDDINEFTNEVIGKMYSYETYTFNISTTLNLHQDINNKFDVYWEYAKRQTEENKELERKKELLASLQNEGTLIDILQYNSNLFTLIANINKQ